MRNQCQHQNRVFIHSLCFVSGEGCHPLWATSKWKEHHCRCLLPATWACKRSIIKCPAFIKRKGVILQCGNARAHNSARQIQEKENNCEKVLPHTSHSPYLAPINFHLFQSLKYFISGKTFWNKDVQNSISNSFFDKKEKHLMGKWKWAFLMRFSNWNEGEYIFKK